MKKCIKYIFTFVALFLFYTNSVAAVTILETTKDDNYDKIEEGSIIIGVSKFEPDVVLTASRVAKAGANDAAFYAEINNSIDGYEAPVIYVYYGVGGWYELDDDNNAIMITDEGLIDDLSYQKLYYVNNVEKKIEVSLDGLKINEEKLPEGVLLQDDNLLVDATLEEFVVYSTDDMIINGYLDEETYEYILKPKCSMNFDSNGGTEVPSQICVGNKVSEPEPPLKNGYKFAGWSLNNKAWDFNWEFNSNVTLKATWIPIVYNIEYDLDGGYFGGSHDTVAKFEEVITINNPKKDGYKFNGWYYDENTYDFYYGITFDDLENDKNKDLHSDPTYINSIYFKNFSNIDGAIVKLTADWKPITYNIEYDLDGGVFGEKHPKNGEFDKVIEISTPTKDGYKFSGWYCAGDAYDFYYGITADDLTNDKSKDLHSDPTYINSTYFKNFSNIDGGTTILTADWKPITYHITLKMNGADTPNSSFSSSDAIWFNSKIWIETPEKEGYTFEGWQVTSGLNPETAKYGDSYKNITNKITDSSLKIKDEYFMSLTNIDGEEVVLEAIWSKE